MEDKKQFNRVEKKYLITNKDKDLFLNVIRQYMREDSYYRSGIFNIYFDNDNFDLIIQSIDHPIFKEKLRARSYEGYDKVFIEIKTKIVGKEENVGYKRRVLISRRDYDELIKHKASMLDLARRDIESRTDKQIAKEIDYFIEHFDLKPKILVYYNRESYVGDNNLRITFDSDLKYRTRNLKFNKKSSDKSYFKNENNIIMEIKAQDALPLWLVHTLSSEHIYPQRFSKIGMIYEKIRKEKTKHV